MNKDENELDNIEAEKDIGYVQYLDRKETKSSFPGIDEFISSCEEKDSKIIWWRNEKDVFSLILISPDVLNVLDI